MKGSILYIGNKLSQHGLTVTSIETLGNLLEREGYTMFYASSKKNKFLRLFEMLVKTLKCRNQVDFVLIDTYSTNNFWYAFLVTQLCRILKLKYILKLEGGNLPNRISKNPRLSKMIFKHAYMNIAPSFYLLNAFKNKDYAKVLYIPNTIELKNYPFKSRKNLHPKLFWVRSFSSIYNPEMAIKVLQNLKEIYPNAELCMVGPDKDGTLIRVKKMAKKLHLDVKFTGRLSKKEWLKLSQKYDVFINTTHFDNTPVSVIEAMAVGLPIISTNVGGIMYLLDNKKTALLIEDNDVQGMTQAIIELLEDENLKENLVANGLNLVEEFDWEKVKIRWNDVLKQA